MTTRSEVLAIAFAVTCAAESAAQDFAFGLHNGGTQTRQLTSAGYTPFEKGITRGVSASALFKPWIAFTLEVLVVDKGLMEAHATPHRYFEVPYMARVTWPWAVKGLRPYAAYGAAFAYELTCDTNCANANRVTTDLSVVSAWGVSARRGPWDLALEQRRTVGQRSTNRSFHTTSDVRSVLVRLSYVIKGVVPDWMQ